MGENTAIEWADHTFNPWIGCTAVSPACDHCYAERLAHRFGVAWGPHAERRRTSESNWRQPLAWNRKAQREGRRFRVFCASLADIMDNQAPITWLVEALDVMRTTPNLIWLLLTKRPQSILRRLAEAKIVARHQGKFELEAWLHDWLNGKPPANIWLGTTVENQTEAHRRIPHLLAVPAAVHFLSCEPLLCPVAIREHWLIRHHPGGARIDWIIAGGESGPKARASHPDWFRSLRDQCEAARVSFFMKQMWGTTKAKMPPIPDDLMIRELPNA